MNDSSDNLENEGMKIQGNALVVDTSRRKKGRVFLTSVSKGIIWFIRHFVVIWTCPSPSGN